MSTFLFAQTTGLDEITAAALLVNLFIYGLFVVPSIAIFWVLYAKAHKPGWAALIPVYNEVVLAQVGKKSIGLGVVAGLFTPLSFIEIFIDSLLLAPLMFITIGFYFYLLFAFIKQYDRGIGWWLLMIFLPIVGVFFVSKANYRDGAVQNLTAAPVPVGAAAAAQPVAAATAIPSQQAQVSQPVVQPTAQPSNDIDQIFMPTKNKDSIIAYYLGFIAIIPVIGLPFAFAAIYYAKKALKLYKENPTPGAKGHAMTGLIMGIVTLVLWAFTILLFAIAAFSDTK